MCPVHHLEHNTVRVLQLSRAMQPQEPMKQEAQEAQQAPAEATPRPPITRKVSHKNMSDTVLPFLEARLFFPGGGGQGRSKSTVLVTCNLNDPILSPARAPNQARERREMQKRTPKAARSETDMHGYIALHQMIQDQFLGASRL